MWINCNPDESKTVKFVQGKTQTETISVHGTQGWDEGLLFLIYCQQLYTDPSYHITRPVLNRHSIDNQHLACILSDGVVLREYN